MPAPTLWARFRHVLGRAFRETGQALDRVGIRGIDHATTSKTYGDPTYKFNDHLSRHRNLFPLLQRGKPTIDENVAFIAPCSTLIGNVNVKENASIWYGAVLRADACHYGYGRSEEEYKKWREYTKEERVRHDRAIGGKPAGGGIYIGAGTNVQDGCIITAREDHAKLGDGVTVGHLAQIHSATVESNSLIGMGSVVNPGAVVKSQAFVAAGAVVGRDEVIESGELWVGNPAKKLRDLTEQERGKLFYQADEYVKVAEGQSNISELGGNVPDTLIEYMMLGGGEESETRLREESLATPMDSTTELKSMETTAEAKESMATEKDNKNEDDEEPSLRAKAV